MAVLNRRFRAEAGPLPWGPDPTGEAAPGLEPGLSESAGRCAVNTESTKLGSERTQLWRWLWRSVAVQDPALCERKGEDPHRPRAERLYPD